MIKMDGKAVIEATIYVHACYWNVFKGASWGAVILTKDERTELRSGSVTLSMPRLLIEGCIEALQRIDMATPVRILCVDEYLTKHVIGSINALHATGYKRKGKLVANSEAINAVRNLTWQRPNVNALTVRRAEWDEGQFRAEELACEWTMPLEDDPPQAAVIASSRLSEPVMRQPARPKANLASPPWD